MKKHIILWIVVLSLILPMMSETVSAAEVVASGTCGDNVTWVLTENGVLTISGEGDMDNYSSANGRQPWKDYADSITNIRVEGTVNSVGSFAFYGLDNLVSEIEEGVTGIGAHAFSGCSNLTSIVIPDSVTTIGDWAFSYCTSLTSVEIGRGVTNIGDQAFYSCGSLTEIRVHGDNACYSSDSRGVLFDKYKTSLIQAPGAISGSYAIPDSVTAIGNSAFYACDNLTSVEIPDSMITIGDYAFQCCSNLVSVEIGNSVTAIGSCAFYECTSLTSVEIPDSVTNIGKDAFSDCSNLASVEIGSSVTTIGSWSFEYCSSLRKIQFRGAAPSIGSNAFYRVTATACYPADDATWTSDVMQDYGGNIIWISDAPATEIASGWSGATQWTLNTSGVLTVWGEGNMKNYDYSGEQPWESCREQITSIVIEEGVTGIGECAFMGLTKLESVTLPESGLTKIGEAAFYGCTSLKEIHIPDGIYTIWAYTFKNCSALESVRLPKTLEKIDQGAFENCVSLPNIFIPGDTEIIGSWSFKGCTGLKEADMQWADATEIREGAFKNCSALSKIHLPADIQILGDSCFYGIGAKSFTVPETVTSVEAWCFARAALTEITFKGDAPEIGEGAFNKITLTAHYPDDNATWTADAMQNYGGSVSWEAN